MGKPKLHYRDDRGIFPLSELVQRSTRDFGDIPVMRWWNGVDGYDEINYPELLKRVESVARWLIDWGLKPGDRVAVLGENRMEWGTSYLGVQCAGGTVVPVDSLMPVSGIRHILSDSGSRLLFVSGKFSEMIDEMAKIKTLEQVVCFDLKEPCENTPFAEVLKQGHESTTPLPERKLDELAAILYTSGTTGFSKGVMLTQQNIVSNVAAASRFIDIGPGDTFLSVLPIHHSFEATGGFLLPLYCGCSITYARSLKSKEIVEDIKNTGVTLMVGVPLLYEKMQQGMMRKIRQQGKEKLVKTMLAAVGGGERLGVDLGKTLFKSLRKKAGMEKVRLFVSGGGPLDPATATFFSRIGIKLMQGYGLTETSPVTHVNHPDRIRHETVGPAIPGVEHKIIDANDAGVGEVCVRGPNIFKGYYKNEEATREVLTEDGWFMTGDMGFIHGDGYLQITGRKKNMLVTGGGKNVYPEEIEHFLNRSPYIAESLVLGIPREKGLGEEVAALIYPDYEQVDVHFEDQKKKASPEDVHALIKGEIKRAQKELADYKRIKTFRLVDEEFQKTSTKKIKRFLYDGDMVKMNGEKV